MHLGSKFETFSHVSRDKPKTQLDIMTTQANGLLKQNLKWRFLQNSALYIYILRWQGLNQELCACQASAVPQSYTISPHSTFQCVVWSN